MALLIVYMLATLGVSFLCSLLESVLMSTPISFITMKKEQGYKPAEKFLKYKSDPDRPLQEATSAQSGKRSPTSTPIPVWVRRQWAVRPQYCSVVLGSVSSLL